MLNLINAQRYIDKIYLYAKYLNESKYKHLINNRENAGIKHLNDSKAFIDRSNTMNDDYENIDLYNPNRRRKVLVVFDDMTADIMTNRKFQSIIKELFIRCRKINISLVFITQCYFSVPKYVRLNSTHYLIMKINNKRELQVVVIKLQVVIITTAQLHSTKPELRFCAGSNPARGMSEIHDGEDL